jgi:hypothetical protein
MKNINDIEVKDHIEVKTLEIKITKVIERDVLENIFVTALEGGSNYWCFLNKDAIALVRKTVPREIEPFLSIAILKAVLDHGVVVPVNDAENEDDILGYIDRDTIQDRLQRLAETNPSYLDVEIEGDGDATSSDVVFQSIVMNEIVFG